METRLGKRCQRRVLPRQLDVSISRDPKLLHSGTTKGSKLWPGRWFGTFRASYMT